MDSKSKNPNLEVLKEIEHAHSHGGQQPLSLLSDLLTKNKAEPFFVANRSQAEKLAKLLFGPQGRTYKNRKTATVPAGTLPEGFTDGVAVGIQAGDVVKLKGVGVDFSAALRTPVLEYVKGGKSYQDCETRLRQVGRHALVQEFVVEALEQWPEFKAMLENLKIQAEMKVQSLVAKAKAEMTTVETPPRS